MSRHVEGNAFDLVVSDETAAWLRNMIEATERHRLELERACERARTDHVDALEWQRACARWNRKHKESKK